MSLLAAALLAFLYLRVTDEAMPGLSSVPGAFYLRLFGGTGLALGYLALTGGALYLCVPAYGAALLLHRLDGTLLARADESIHSIMKNRR